MLALLLFLSLTMPPEIGWEEAAVIGPTRTVTLSTSRTFEAVVISSSEQTPPLRARAADDEGRWGAWFDIAIDHDSSENGILRSGIVHFGRAATLLEVAFEGGAGERVALTLFPQAERTDRDRTRISSYEVGPLTVISRSDWQCPDGQGSRWTPTYTTVTHAVVHHTAGSNSVANWQNEVRSIWSLHTFTNGWGDIGYNFLIDPNGVVYEGRAGGDGALGAHFSCRNTNTVGVALLGTYSTAQPTDAAIASLETLLRELARRHTIDPTGTRLHVPSNLLVPTIIGHRDGNNSSLTCTKTECPGEVLYGKLPALRVAAACSAPVITAAPETVAIDRGNSATLDVEASGTGPLRYSWFLAGSTDAIGNEATITVSPEVTTAYIVRVTNDCGSAESQSVTVVVGAGPRRRGARP